MKFWVKRIARKRVLRRSFMSGCSGMPGIVSEGWERNNCLTHESSKMSQILYGDFIRNPNQTKHAYPPRHHIKCGLVFTDKILWTCGKEKSVQDTHIILQDVDSGRLGAAASHGYVTNFWPACATKWIPVSSYRRKKKRRRKGRRNRVRATPNSCTASVLHPHSSLVVPWETSWYRNRHHPYLSLHVFCNMWKSPRYPIFSKWHMILSLRRGALLNLHPGASEKARP